MNESASQLAYLRDPRLAAHALSAAPAWLWTADATRILWTNAVGAAIFGTPGPAVLASQRFDAKDPAAAQIARIAESLPPGGAPRLERLRGFGGGFGQMLTCACSRILLSDNTSAVLVLAAEAAGPSLPLAERARRLLAEIDAPIAIFSAEGVLLHAAAPAREGLAAATTLAFLGPDALAADALRNGHAAGPTKIGTLSIERIGQDSGTALIATLVDAAATDATTTDAVAPPSPPQTEPAAAPVESETAAATSATSGAALPERRHPLRFVWKMDADGRFHIESGDFVRLTGPRTAKALGRAWNDIAAELGLDPEGQVAQAVATRDTWSGIVIDWPLDGTEERLTVEMSGLPVFDRDRSFGGYRGFGVCRDARRISIAASLRDPAAAPPQAERDKPAEAEPAAPPEQAIPVPVPLPAEERPVFSIVPPAKNVVPFRASAATEKTPSLSPVERKAFRELARQLTTRLQQSNADAAPLPPAEADDVDVQPPGREPAADDAAAGGAREAMGFVPVRSAQAVAARTEDAEKPAAHEDRTILNRLPTGILVYRLDTLLYANRAFLEWTGHDDLAELAQAGGLDNLFVEMGASQPGDGAEGRSLTITANRGDQHPAQGRLFSASWEGETAHVLMLLPATGVERDKATDPALKVAQAEIRELRAILDTATDGVLLLDADGYVRASNRSAEALFGYDTRELSGFPFADLFAPESRRTALDYLQGLAGDGVASLLNDGREVIGRVRQGGLVPLFMTMGRIGEEPGKFCAVFRDITPWKKTEEEIINAKRQAEKASSAKSDFLAKISHEIRTPLNAIIGFSEVMMGERFGPIANDRYREYLKDIHASGGHLVSLLNDLLDLSKIEAGKLDLNFTGVNLNELTQQCVAIMQPQANQERVVIRTSLPPELPAIVADARSMRQIILNLLSNSIKFTGAGGQVIVSTALTDHGEVALRVRDTGVGMTEKEIQMALEPFRQLATSARWGSGGSGLGLPLTKALAEANRADFTITSTVNAGTLVEISFPPARVLAG